MKVFRKLRADEIDCRVGQVKEGKGFSLLLYKDARCDQNVLDETVGPMNWQRHHSRDNANCTVAIWDDTKEQWIEKEDTGTESRTEAEKGLASDSFKRACVNWGIGRELYTAPFIWIPGKCDRFTRYSVDHIAYNEAGDISELTIGHDTEQGHFVDFQFPRTQRKESEQTKPQSDMNKSTQVTTSKTIGYDAIAAIKHYCEAHKISSKEFDGYRKALIAGDVIPNITYDKMTKEHVEQLLRAIEANGMLPEAS